MNYLKKLFKKKNIVILYMEQEKIFRVYFFSILDLKMKDEICMKEFKNRKFNTIEKAHEFGEMITKNNHKLHYIIDSD